MNWSYGVTTVQSRRADLLPRTLASLAAGGFDRPRIFVDGDWNLQGWSNEFRLPITCRYPMIHAYGNWLLAALELLIREPHADRYALFQDDLVTYKNLRQYLEKIEYPEPGYLNLYTWPSNQELCPRSRDGQQKIGFYKGYQSGKGAVALVFSNDALRRLLKSGHVINRLEHNTKIDDNTPRAWKCIDGGISDAMKSVGYAEYVHHPSLTQHTGELSAAANHKRVWSKSLATSFRGEDFDALQLLQEQVSR